MSLSVDAHKMPSSYSTSTRFHYVMLLLLGTNSLAVQLMPYLTLLFICNQNPRTQSAIFPQSSNLRTVIRSMDDVNLCFWEDEAAVNADKLLKFDFQHEKVISENIPHESVISERFASTERGFRGEDGNSMQVKWEEVRLRSLGNSMFDCDTKNLKITGIKLCKDLAELHLANKMIKRAFVELYKEMDYLQKYRTLNMLAFCKILKKFDGITGKNSLSVYLKEVESSYFNTTNRVDKLMDEVEQLFVDNFAENGQKKAMKYLRPNHHRESHFTSFFTGLFAGCLAAFLSAYSLIAHIAKFYSARSHIVYIETAYPILSIFILLFLHLFLYGCNISTWRKIHVNYSFIFEFNPVKHLKYRDVFLICMTSMSVVMGIMLVHSYLIINGLHSTLVQAIPILLLLFFMAVLLCPFNVVYHSSRYSFLNVIRKIVMAPFCKVVMVDFFVADQLCSQVVMLRDLAYVSCYYMTGSYKTQDYGFCTKEEPYLHLPCIISFLPYYWRSMQCARRWFDEGQTCHLINMGKYISTMLAITAKVAYENEKDMKMLIILVAVSSITTVYQLYWDFVEDWGLLRFNSRNPWLRNDLMIRWKPIYFFSMGLNVILRLSWLHIVLRFSFRGVDYRVTTFFLAALEIIRRAQGNFYRLENEQLNNAGKFRAVKAVPLPFHEVY